MATKLIHKNSKVQFKNATGAQLEFGELAINYHSSGPFLQAKGEDGKVHSLGGVYIGSTAPSNPLPGRWFFDTDDDKLYMYDGSAWKTVTGSGGGGSSLTVIGGDGITVTTAAGKATVAVDLASSPNGLVISSGELKAEVATKSSLGTVSIGKGLDVTSGGEISVDASGIDINVDLNYKSDNDKAGVVENSGGDDATIPIATNTVAGLFTGAEKKQLADLVAGAPVTISETAPASPTAGDLWWTNTDTAEGGGRLYTWTGTEWVDVSIPGGALTKTDADKVYLSKTSNDTAAGAITFNNLTTHEGGVKVTSGGPGSVVNGMYLTGSKEVGISSSGKRGLRISRDTMSFNTQSDANGGVSLDTKSCELALWAPENDTKIGTHEHSYLETTANSNVHNKFKKVSGITVNKGSVQPVVVNAAGNTGYAYYTDLGNGDKADAKFYAFYSAGNSPSYFAGFIRKGNVTNPGGTDTDGNPETDDHCYKWTTSSSVSDAVRIGNNFAQISRYSTNANVSPYAINRLGSSTGKLIAFADDGVEIDTIALDGSGGISYGTSDYRAKENIVDLPSAVDQIKALRPVNFNFTWAPGKTRPGFIAHEVAEALPAAVVGEKDETETIGTLLDWDGTELEIGVAEPSTEELTYEEKVEVTPYVASVEATYDEEGNELTPYVEEVEPTYETVTRTKTWTATGERPVYQRMDVNKLVPLLTKALQEVLQKNEDLESRIAALEGA